MVVKMSWAYLGLNTLDFGWCTFGNVLGGEAEEAR